MYLGKTDKSLGLKYRELLYETRIREELHRAAIRCQDAPETFGNGRTTRLGANDDNKLEQWGATNEGHKGGDKDAGQTCLLIGKVLLHVMSASLPRLRETFLA